MFLSFKSQMYLLREVHAVFVFSFPESVVMIIVPQFERTFCHADVGLRLVVVLPFDHGLVNDSLFACHTKQICCE